MLRKRINALMISLYLAAGIIAGPELYSFKDTVVCTENTVSASVVKTDGKVTDNASKNDLGTFVTPVTSYVYEGENPSVIYRVEYIKGTEEREVILEKYNEGKLESQKNINMELPEWGGFFCGAGYNYCVFGQNNEEESADIEIMRVVKYDKNWNRISSASVYGANTVKPFYFGSLRMDESNGYLSIHTCHSMFFSDGANHQANMTYVIDENTMSVHQQYFGIKNLSVGYISHSFNQFVKTEGDTMYRVDHGDSRPRSVVFTKSGVHNITACRNAEIFNISGNGGDNYTGVTLGGFELSDSYGIVAGSSQDQTITTGKSATAKNIFISITDKESLANRWYYLTDYKAEDKIKVCTPKLVKINSNKFIVMWEEFRNGRYYTMAAVIDGQGNVIKKPLDLNVRLSDCQPVLASDGNIKWYVTNKTSPVFYSLNPDDFSEFHSNFTWNYDSETSTLTLSGDGETWAFDKSSHPWKDFNYKVSKIVVEEGITKINDGLFERMSSINEVILPDTLTEIGNRAFSDCLRLRTVNFPESLKVIGEKAFYGIPGFTYARINSPDVMIGEKAFGYIMKSNEDTLNTNFVLYGHQNSTSSKYAADNEIKFRDISELPDELVSGVKGDVNNDGILDMKDILLFKNSLLLQKSSQAVNLKAGDMNKDGTLNVIDFNIMKNDLLKIIKLQNKPLETGDVIELGIYSGEPLKWRVAGFEDENTAFLFCENVIDWRRYTENVYLFEPLSWQNSSVRSFLNNEFYKTAFNEYEKNLIKLDKIEFQVLAADENGGLVNGQLINYTDRVFIPSVDIWKKYNLGDYRGKYTSNAEGKNNGRRNVTWWFLNTVIDSGSVFPMYYDESTGRANIVYSLEAANGIRPCIRINVS